MIRVFRHYVPRSLVLLGTFEALVLVFSLYVGTLLTSAQPPVSTADLDFPEIFFFLGVMLSAMIATGLYQRNVCRSARGIVFRVTLSFMCGFGLMALSYVLFPNVLFENGVVLPAIVSAFVGVLVVRVLFLRAIDQSLLVRRVLVVGAGSKAEPVARLHTTNLRDALIVGFLSVANDPVAVGRAKVWPASTSLSRLVDEQDIDEIVVALEDRRKNFPMEDLLTCKMNGIEVLDLVQFLERQTGKIQVESLHPCHFIFADGYVQTVMRPMSKRLFDVVASMGLLAVTWPLMLITMIAIKLESGRRAPVFYSQTRVGAHGKLFRIMKFRSMIENAESTGAMWAEENDPRITRVGAFIRKTRIDELPQLWNVLKGNMSFVGPRPERPEFVAKLIETIPYYNLRHGMKPGITGWAQVSFPYGASEEDALEKLQYDLYYMKNGSVFLDINILLQTIQVILWRKGSR